jgi:FKBP-type peptidyl-prolyl cis-trans isomerase FkpA
MAPRARRLTATLSILLLTACSQPPPYTGGDVAELQRIDVVSGQGATAVAGDEISVHYTGWLYDQAAADKRGRKFDSSRDRGQPFVFLLGAGRVIRGWDDGVAGMRVGGKRELRIPADLGYGRGGARDVIPPGASLVFEVELLDTSASDLKTRVSAETPEAPAQRLTSPAADRPRDGRRCTASDRRCAWTHR